MCIRLKTHFQYIGTIDAIEWHITIQLRGSICANSYLELLSRYTRLAVRRRMMPKALALSRRLSCPRLQ